MAFPGFANDPIKKPNVAGQFYTADPAALSAQIQTFLKKVPQPEGNRRVGIVIVPHAGYIYSGQIAAQAFKHVVGKKYTTVVVLAPSHHYGFPGISVWTEGGFETPLGILTVDQSFAKELMAADPLFIFEPAAFEREHALEVELPFIQEAVGKDVKIVPVIMGQADFSTCEKAAEALNRIIGSRKDVLVVVSSDMSHFHDDQTARAMDGQTLGLIQSFQARQLWQLCAVQKLEMCGFVPATTAILLAQKQGLAVDILTYGNSGDVTGDKGNVVGYSATVFYDGPDPAAASKGDEGGVGMLTPVQKKRLIGIAQETIRLYVSEGKTLNLQEKDARLNQQEGAFVTIHKHGQLRGCIGNIVGRQPLYLTVRDMAVAAAAQDPRFNPVSKEELKEIDIEISVLSEPRPAASPDEIQMGVHGVIVKRGFHQGVFLPQVATETGWSREEFLAQLCAQKAGLPPDAWKDPRTQLLIFTATVFSEADVQ